MLSIFKTKPEEVQPAGDNDLINMLRIIRTEKIGPKTFFDLVKIYKDYSKIVDVIPNLSLRGGKSKPVEIASKDAIEKEIENTLSYGANYVTYNDKNYSNLLRKIDSAPPVLVVYGNRDISKIKNISIVGSRNASHNGCMFAKKISSDLGKRNYIITSGLARGIDKYAHEGALDTGTIAVVAGGIDIIYPQEHKDLYEKIKDSNGSIIAEMPYGIAPISKHFPLRNRIIAGISVATLVVEASLGSGSLITAHNALDFNRDVFAVPGFPADPRSKGTNQLIKEGAHVAENYQDILDIVENIKFEDLILEEGKFSFTNPEKNYDNINTDNVRKEILEKLSYYPIKLDELVYELKIDIQIIYLALIELELAEKIVRNGNNIALKMNLEEDI